MKVNRSGNDNSGRNKPPTSQDQQKVQKGFLIKKPIARNH